MTMNWNTLYSPKIKDEMIIGKETADSIDKFVKQFATGNVEAPCLLIVGPNGTGKSMTVSMILKENGYEIGTVDLENIYIKSKTTKAADAGRISDICWYSTFSASRKLTLDGGFVKRKMALVWDDANNISKPNNKECLKSILRLNNKHKAFPIIIIATCKHNKLFSDIRSRLTYGQKKYVNEIKFNKPTYCTIKKLWDHIIAKEHMDIDPDLCNIILEHVHHDIRRFIGVLEELQDIYRGRHIDFDMFCHYQQTFDSKIVDLGIFHSSSAILNKYQGVEETLNLFSNDRSNLPLMIHENYTRTVYLKSKSDIIKQAHAIFQVAKSLSESDKIDGLTYSKSCWSLQDAYGFHACVVPSYIIGQIPKKCNKISQNIYGKDFYKTTTKKNNQKYIRQLRMFSELKKMSNTDFLHISNIVKELLLRQEYETVAELIKPYSFDTIKDFGLLIKIDKIKKPDYYLWQSKFLRKKIYAMVEEGKDISKYCRLFRVSKQELIKTINLEKQVEPKYLPTGKGGKAFEALLNLRSIEREK